MGEQGDWARMALRMENLASELVDVRDVEDTLDGVLKLTVWMAPCDVASVSLRHGGGKVETTAASDPVAQRAHELQQELGEGPCLDVVWDEEGVNVVPDLADSNRWPRWSEFWPCRYCLSAQSEYRAAGPSTFRAAAQPAFHPRS